MVSTRRKKAAISAEFIEDSDESDGNETYQEEDSSDECGGEDDDDEEEEEEKAEMSELEIVEVPTTPRKCGRPRKAPAAMPTPAKFVICIYIIKNLTVVHRGKKRPIDEVAASDSDGPFNASPIHDSPKKPRVAPSATKKPPTMPLKATPAKAATKAASPTKLKTTPAVNNKSTSPSKAASAKKSKVAAINEDDDELEQESMDSDDPRYFSILITPPPIPTGLRDSSRIPTGFLPDFDKISKKAFSHISPFPLLLDSYWTPTELKQIR
ncbi:uncharacterized protein LACBIDRAFT_333681 [Laccaria bicolor S238N-H82]|uniref:Predicted protein n=1 Tax=Laccaria bicolor (strain S238N-H82 / ATCC MYA-4686) TaxID=486041 RepID=B0DWL0_LACBS|nr:uncharacterized protein LACBIDRAFT_333681 [Laccaria bicolor S238N-H82]EDR00997.1 predicted protein [Laccaria bicolor S238N-H82]|eukprot:XP_001888392.1 predicted protein [Laccaria bicolor S238N-H82]